MQEEKYFTFDNYKSPKNVIFATIILMFISPEEIKFMTESLVSEVGKHSFITLLSCLKQIQIWAMLSNVRSERRNCSCSCLVLSRTTMMNAKSVNESKHVVILTRICKERALRLAFTGDMSKCEWSQHTVLSSNNFSAQDECWWLTSTFSLLQTNVCVCFTAKSIIVALTWFSVCLFCCNVGLIIIKKRLMLVNDH